MIVSLGKTQTLEPGLPYLLEFVSWICSLNFYLLQICAGMFEKILVNGYYNSHVIWSRNVGRHSNMEKPAVCGDDGLTSIGETPTSKHTVPGPSTMTRATIIGCRIPSCQRHSWISKTNETLAEIVVAYQVEIEGAPRRRHVLNKFHHLPADSCWLYISISDQQSTMNRALLPLARASQTYLLDPSLG